MEKITVKKERENSFDLEEINFSDEQDNFVKWENKIINEGTNKNLSSHNEIKDLNSPNNIEKTYFENDENENTDSSIEIATHTLLDNRNKNKHRLKAKLGSLKITNKPKDRKQNSSQSDKHLLVLLFSFFNKKNLNIAKVLSGWFIILSMVIINKLLADHFIEYGNFYRNPSIISIFFSLIMTILITVSPSYFNRLYYKVLFFDILTLSVFSLCQIYLLTHLDCLHSLIFLTMCYPIFMWILIHKRFDVRDTISIVLYFNLISTVFISIYLDIQITLTKIFINVVILVYIILHCHVIYCLNHNFNANGRIAKDSSSSSLDYESFEKSEKASKNENNKRTFLDKIIRLIKSRNNSKNKNSLSKMIFRVYTDSYEVIKISINILLANNHR